MTARVDVFFTHLMACLERVNVPVDRVAIVAWLAQPALRAAHDWRAQTDPARYTAITDDLVATARSFGSSITSQTLLLDWITLAPLFVLDRFPEPPIKKRRDDSPCP